MGDEYEQLGPPGVAPPPGLGPPGAAPPPPPPGPPPPPPPQQREAQPPPAGGIKSLSSSRDQKVFEEKAIKTRLDLYVTKVLVNF
uniref:Uncharacterized protein n=1 Tax=Angiostrongylus cantonensis TaxID=6313 RepID=A0A0K0D2K9_ANGCA